MLSPEVLKKIRHIQLKTRRVLSGSLVGDYRTAKKGFGFEFEQLAEYQFGDDIRFIDWKSSARMNKLLLKEYREERNRTIMLLVDGSLSHFFGSTDQLKHEQVAEIACVIALAAQNHKDLVGLIIVTDEVEVYIPPKSGKKHMHTIMETLFTFKPKARQTKLSVGMQKLMQVKRNDTLTFLISDFIDSNFEKDLRMIAKHHEIIAIRCRDAVERALPSIGFIECEDIESGETIMINTDDKRLKNILKQQENQLDKLLRMNKIKCLDIVPQQEYIQSLINFFLKLY